MLTKSNHQNRIGFWQQVNNADNNHSIRLQTQVLQVTEDIGIYHQRI